MSRKYVLVLLLPLFLLVSCKDSKVEEHHDYPISVVAFTKVKLQDNFWKQRIETNREVTIPYGLQKCEEEGRMRNFERAAGVLDGEYEGKMPFDDSDVYKIIEGISYSLQTNPDKKLEAYTDELIAKIAAAQQDDGYLQTWKIINPEKSPATWVKPGPRWFNLGVSHELYDMGHLYEAAYAHYRATGKKTLLNVALKNADLIDKTFGPEEGKLHTPPGHQIIETGLIKLYRATGQEKYINLAKYFLDIRGDSTTHDLYGAYSQDSIKVVDQEEAMGHAVRAVYMYAAMTDIAALLKDKAYEKAVDKIWNNVVSKKMYITGGLGARHEGEAFGDNYELPNLTAYNETCAAIGGIYWNERMFLLHGDSKYIDVLERTLYNGMISGVSLEGNTFFYPNCLESDGKYAFNQGALTRKPWFDCSCCPTNVTRFMPSVSDYIYAQKDDSLYVNLYIASEADINVNDAKIALTQSSKYPWDGNVKIDFASDKDVDMTVKVRVPGWVQGKPVPSDLYSYENSKPADYTITVNGKPVSKELDKGYVDITRKWSDGDIIEIAFPMEVHRVIANSNVKDDQGKVALERGPVVYCAEWPDNSGKVLDISVPDNSELSYKYEGGLLGGIVEIKGDAERENGRPEALTAIPYYSWSHRGVGEMAVWLHRK